MDKEDVVHIYNGILLIHKTEQNNPSCSNMLLLLLLLLLSHFSRVRPCATP